MIYSSEIRNKVNYSEFAFDETVEIIGSVADLDQKEDFWEVCFHIKEKCD